MKTPRLALCLSALLALAPHSHADDKAPLVAQKPVVIPGVAGKFDYMNIDSKNRRLLAAHTAAGMLEVFDITANKPLASIPVGTAQGVIVDKANDQYITGNSKDQKVVFVDRKTLKITGEVATAGPVDDLELNTKTGMVYADHDDGTDVWVIDAKTKKLVGSVTIPEAPEFLVYDAPTDRLYQNIKSNSTVQVIDPNTNKVVAVWESAAGAHGLAIDHKLGRVFSAGNQGKLMIFDIKTGKPLSSVAIAPGTDQIAYDAKLKRVYCACKGMVSVVQITETGASLLANVPSPAGAHTIAVDPKTHSVWVSYADKEHSYVQEFKVEVSNE